MRAKIRDLLITAIATIKDAKKFAAFYSSHRVVLMKLAISFVVIVYSVSAIAYISPPSALRDTIVEKESSWWQFFGFDQRWALFAPSIRTVNFDVVCLITYNDGAMSLWQPPRVELMSLLERYQKDKFRKWGMDSLPGSRYQECWPDFSRYVGRLHTKAGCAKPVSVMLMMYSHAVPKPSLHVKLKDLPEHTDYKTVFYYRLKPEDLL